MEVFIFEFCEFWVFDELLCRLDFGGGGGFRRLMRFWSGEIMFNCRVFIGFFMMCIDDFDVEFWFVWFKFILFRFFSLKYKLIWFDEDELKFIELFDFSLELFE